MDACFQGEWICAAQFADLKPLALFHREHEELKEYTHDENLKNFHMLVQKKFTLCKPGGVITMRITADDYYKLYINGRFVGQGPAPGYYFAYYFNEFDITPFLTDGENLLTVHVYYQGLINRVWNSGDYRMGLIADIFTDDGTVLLSTDGTWEYAVDPSYVSKRTTGYKTQYLEDVDSRLTPADWKPVSEKQADYTFVPEPVKAVQVYEVKPVLSCRLSDGGWFYDFSTELTAGLKITASGKSGQRLRILCGEELSEDGRVRYQMRSSCEYEEFWTLKEGENLLEQYDYKAFRYVELVPEDGAEFAVDSVTALMRHYPFSENACTLETSDTVLKTVFELCKTGVKLGAQEVFVDCPGREKGQYLGDLTVTAAAHLYLTGDGSLMKKALENMAQSLTFTPGMLAVAPGSLMQEIADYSLQFPLSVWRYYVFSGDYVFLKQMSEPCKSVLDYFRKYRRPDGLLLNVDEKWNLVDWPQNLRDDYDFPLTKPVSEGCHNVINAFYVGAVQTVERMERELLLPCTDESARLKEAFNKCFFRPALGVYADSETSDHASLHSNCVPAFYGLCPKGYEKSVSALLIQKGLCCGVYMAFFLLKALSRLGEYGAVYDLITSTGEASWYNMAREGGTACFEAWGKDQKWNTSLCHPWASAPVTVLIEELIGLTLYPDKTYTVTPHLPQKLKYLEMNLPVRNIHFRVKREE